MGPGVTVQTHTRVCHRRHWCALGALVSPPDTGIVLMSAS